MAREHWIIWSCLENPIYRCAGSRYKSECGEMVHGSEPAARGIAASLVQRQHDEGAEPSRSHKDEIRVVRSERRRSTVTLREKDGYYEVLAPARWADEKLQPIITRLVRRLEKRRTRNALDETALLRRAESLNEHYFEGRLRWSSIVWVSNQGQRWGSCTPLEGTIRLSHRLASYPSWVLDYVIVHELAHLVVAAHNRRFWSLVARYPLAERARGYLIAKAGEDQEDEM